MRGRRYKHSDEEFLTTLNEEGCNALNVAKRLGVSKVAVYRRMGLMGIAPQKRPFREVSVCSPLAIPEHDRLLARLNLYHPDRGVHR